MMAAQLRKYTKKVLSGRHLGGSVSYVPAFGSGRDPRALRSRPRVRPPAQHGA